MEVKNSFLRNINPVIKFLIISDTVIIGASGLLGPIFALFIEGFIEGGNEAVAGFAVGIYLFTKSILQIPIAYIIDKTKGEKDDFWFMFVFTILVSIIPLFYLIIRTPLELYIVQFILGLFTSFTFPTYMAIFTRHVDKEREAMEWGIYHTLIDITSAVFAAIGGYFAFVQGFSSLIITVVIISLIGSLILLPIKNYIK